MKQVLERMIAAAIAGNANNIVELIERRPTSRADLCDLGAGDGFIANAVLRKLNFDRVSVVELEATNARKLAESGFTVYEYDLNQPLPIPDESFDVVVSNQVIEHLYDTDLFLAETFRILRPNGVAVISTENLASWHNVVALVLGWQPFSLTNVTRLAGGVGNPFALHRGETGNPFPMQHHRLFSTRTLGELMQLHGFTEIEATGSGYYPLPSSVGRIDTHHAHLIAVAGRKPAIATASR